MTTITMQTLVERINEQLAQQSQKLIKTDAEHFDQSELGDYFIKDLKTTHAIDAAVDPVRLGRQLGVLRDTERVKARLADHHIRGPGRSRSLTPLLA